MSVIKSNSTTYFPLTKSVQPPAAEEAAAPANNDVVILPQQADSLDHARQQMQDAGKLFKTLGVKVEKELKAAGGVKAEATAEQREALMEAGFQVIEDRPIGSAALPLSVKGLESGWLVDRLPMFGPFDPFAPLRPRELMPQPRARVRQQSSEGPSDYTGKLQTSGRGVTIAVLDTGVYPHPDLGDRLLGNVSPVAANRGYIGKDPVGHGTHVAGDAAGDGRLSRGRLAGPAPGANVIGVQVLAAAGHTPGQLSQVLEEFTAGVEWMVDNKDKYNIRVANMSLGFPLQVAQQGWFGPRTLFDPIGAAINEAVQSGIVVVAAAGNEGPGPQTITSTPGINQNVITVGALDTNGTPQDPSDDRVAQFSSRGPSPGGRRGPDIIAPGVNILAANSPGSEISQQNHMVAQFKAELDQMSNRDLRVVARQMVQRGMLPYDAIHLSGSELRELFSMGMEVKDSGGRLKGDTAYLAMDGTSMASPIVAGVVAAMLEANPNLTPEEVKLILTKTADPLPREPFAAQGHGAVDAREAVAIAAEVGRRRAS